MEEYVENILYRDWKDLASRILSLPMFVGKEQRIFLTDLSKSLAFVLTLVADNEKDIEMFFRSFYEATEEWIKDEKEYNDTLAEIRIKVLKEVEALRIADELSSLLISELGGENSYE